MRTAKRYLIVASLLFTSTPLWAQQDLKVLLDNSSNAGSAEEFAKRFKRYFNRHDIDGVDGLSEEDRRMFIERETNRFLNQAEERLKKHDLNGNGIATPEEIEAASRQSYGYQPTQELNDREQKRVAASVKLFLKGDLNGDGAVTKAEILAREEKAVDRMVALNQMIFDAFLNGIDSDGDGIVQFSDVEASLFALLKE
ncbi:MAG: hypothetical protein ABJ251_22945 [Paracoccaceae bacterium]